MSALRELIRRHTGIALRPDRNASLDSFVRARIEALSIDTVEAYCARLEGEPFTGEEWRELVAVVSNGHTAFCRDMGQLETVGDALEELADTRARSLSVWCAGCSTGEEPYTLAMLARERGIEARVLGTDIDQDALAHAQRARYRTWALRRVPSAWKRKHFEGLGEDVWSPHPDVEAGVHFAVHNLLSEQYPRSLTGHWDIILCRNVFIYFDAPTVQRVLAGFASVLADDGYVFLGHSDMLHAEPGKLRRDGLGGRLRYRHARVSPSAPPAVLPELAPDLSPPPPPLEPAQRDAPGLDEKALAEAVKEGQLERAEALILRAVGGEEPQRLGMLLGNVRLARHHFEAAAVAYDEAHRVDPLRAEVHYLRALLGRRTGQLEHAVESCRRALFLEPDLWPASFLLASLLARVGAGERSRAEYRHTLALVTRQAHETPPLASYLEGLQDLFPSRTDVEEACRFHLRGSD